MKVNLEWMLKVKVKKNLEPLVKVWGHGRHFSILKIEDEGTRDRIYTLTHDAIVNWDQGHVL